ncbi:MAG: carboxypeptidase regulatory-like domain-containing protein, partial [Bryobacteraceae bacterium]|nr:carboxypeptidase regulatory-like domain-containing protein [Bryobacteraceae bacterium]
GNQSRHLQRQPDINLPSFSVLSENAQLPPAQRASVNALRPYKGFSQILARLSDANSNYNSLQLYATKRKGALTWTASYTFSKALADASSNSDVSDEPFNHRYNYGPASFDRSHIFVSTFIVRTPSLRRRGAWLRGSLGAWELSGIGRAQSGQPYTVFSNTPTGLRRADYVGGDLYLPSGERTVNRWFNTGAFAAPPADRFGNSGFNNLRGPGLTLFDFSLRKVFSITEQVKLRFQADAFNAFNKANFRGFTTNTADRDFGAVTASGPGRNVQLGMRLTF